MIRCFEQSKIPKKGFVQCSISLMLRLFAVSYYLKIELVLLRLYPMKVFAEKTVRSEICEKFPVFGSPLEKL